MPRFAATLPALVALAVAGAGAAVGSAAPPAPTGSAGQADGVVRLHVPAATAPADATAAGSADDGVVIRAQNRAGRGKRSAAPAARPTPVRQASVRQASARQTAARPTSAAPALPPAPTPRMHAAQSGPAQSGAVRPGAVRPVAGEEPIADMAVPGGVRTVNGVCHNGECETYGSRRGPHGAQCGPHGPRRSCGRCPAGTCFGLGGRHGAYANCPHCKGQCPPAGCPVCLGVPGLPVLPGCGLFAPGSGLFAPGGYFNRGGVWVPRHVHSYSYDAPEGLLYPPGANNPNVPGRMGPMPAVQYPYYTTKGPDDYFHDRDGEF